MSTRMWKVQDGKLFSVESGRLDKESRLEDWLEADPKMLGLDVLIIGRQVASDYGGKIDLLAMDEDGDLALIELKRDKTPREVVAQILDYASWIADLPPKRVHEIAEAYFSSSRVLKIALLA